MGLVGSLLPNYLFLPADHQHDGNRESTGFRGPNEMKWEGRRLSITKFILRPSTTTITLLPSGGFMLNCLEVQLQARGQTDSAFPPSKILVFKNK